MGNSGGSGGFGYLRKISDGGRVVKLRAKGSPIKGVVKRKNTSPSTK
jgi:hypothetical protein